MVGTGVVAGHNYRWASSAADQTFIAANSNAASLAGWPQTALAASGSDWVLAIGYTSLTNNPAWSFTAGHAYTGTALTPY